MIILGGRRISPHSRKIHTVYLAGLSPSGFDPQAPAPSIRGEEPGAVPLVILLPSIGGVLCSQVCCVLPCVLSIMLVGEPHIQIVDAPDRTVISKKRRAGTAW
jgi:hypothetical protein